MTPEQRAYLNGLKANHAYIEDNGRESGVYNQTGVGQLLELVESQESKLNSVKEDLNELLEQLNMDKEDLNKMLMISMVESTLAFLKEEE